MRVMIMLLYHGSNLTVAVPKLVPQNRFLDFGYGFYTTTNKAQAIGALKIKKLYKQLVFASEKALSFLRFIGTVPGEEF